MRNVNDSFKRVRIREALFAAWGTQIRARRKKQNASCLMLGVEQNITFLRTAVLQNVHHDSVVSTLGTSRSGSMETPHSRICQARPSKAMFLDHSTAMDQ